MSPTASYHNLNSKELRAIEMLVREREDEFRAAWDSHFSQ